MWLEKYYTLHNEKTQWKSVDRRTSRCNYPKPMISKNYHATSQELPVIAIVRRVGLGSSLTALILVAASLGEHEYCKKINKWTTKNPKCTSGLQHNIWLYKNCTQLCAVFVSQRDIEIWIGPGLEHWTTHASDGVMIFRGLWSERLNVTTESGNNKEIFERQRKPSLESMIFHFFFFEKAYL